MNIFTAPLAYLVSPFSSQLSRQIAPGGGPRGGANSLVWGAIALTVILVIAGIYLTFRGGAGDIQISAFGIELTTKTGGIALAALGLIFYFAMAKLIKDGA